MSREPNHLDYTQPSLVNSIVTDLHPPINRSVTGYGSKLPTRHRIRYGKRWYRVYAICYGNAASLYITVAGERQFVDYITEYALSEGLNSEHLGI